jgi:hypothetical protein
MEDMLDEGEARQVTFPRFCILLNSGCLEMDGVIEVFLELKAHSIGRTSR